MKPLSLLLFVCFCSSIVLSSCNGTYSSGASVVCELEVTVKGAFSGKPREGLHVTLYKTETDADDQKNSVSSAYTNVDGVAFLDRLEPGARYWVRAQALLSKSIRNTSTMSSGKNYFKMTIL